MVRKEDDLCSSRGQLLHYSSTDSRRTTLRPLDTYHVLEELSYRHHHNLAVHYSFGLAFCSTKVQFQQGNHPYAGGKLDGSPDVRDIRKASAKALCQQRNRHDCLAGDELKECKLHQAEILRTVSWLRVSNAQGLRVSLVAALSCSPHMPQLSVAAFKFVPQTRLHCSKSVMKYGATCSCFPDIRLCRTHYKTRTFEYFSRSR